MKKFISLFLILSLIFCFAACGGNETPDENSGNNIVNNVDDNQNADNITSNKEITLEDVENAPVSPESDFHYYDVDGGIEVVYDGDDEIVVVPETIDGKNVVAVARRGFVNADTVRAVKLANSIKFIGDNAFHSNESIEILVAGSGLETIGYCAIGNCENLRILTLNDGLKEIDVGGISMNPKLMELDIPNSVTQIDYVPTQGSIIICESGSEAENFAKLNGYEYRLK